jgi:LemA protein
MATSIDEKIAAENKLSSALQGLKVTIESYPDLKANQNFMHLQEEVALLQESSISVKKHSLDLEQF